MTYPVVTTQKGVFARMSMYLEKDDRYKDISAYIKENFVLLRVHAEELAMFHCKSTNVDNVTLESIYDALLMTGELSENETKKLMLLEQDTVKELFASSCFKNGDGSSEELSWLEGMEDNFPAQLLAGASKRAIVEEKLKGPAKIGAHFGGPILMPYVEWILQRSEALGFTRLYFIARDGYILKCMADEIIEHLGLKIETHYIHGSRKAWRMPSYLGREGDLKELVGWAHTQHIHTADDLADALQLPADDLRSFLIQEYADKGRQLNGKELSLSVFMLDKSAEFRNMLKESLAEKRQLVVDYLKQEIDVSDNNFAFVELAGGGFTQTCLANLMQDFYDGTVKSFFYKMDRVRKPNKQCVFYDFFPSKLRNDLVIEMVCRAAEGQTEGYRYEGDRVIPIKKEGERELYLKAGYEEYLKGIELFTVAYKDIEKKYRPAPSIKASLACIRYLSNKADDETLKFFAGLPNSVTGREKEVPSFAPPLTKRQVQDIYVRYADGKIGAHYAGTDFDTSIKCSSPYIQRLVKKYEKFGRRIRERWLKMYSDMLKKPIFGFPCPYSVFGRRVVLYGAGKRGRMWYRELSADNAIDIVQWLDKDYMLLKDELPVTGDMDCLGQVPFDWIIVDFANSQMVESVIEGFQQRGVSRDIIYTPEKISDWLSKRINYLNV